MTDIAQTLRPALSPETREALAGRFPLLIDGAFVESRDGTRATSYDPATECPIAQVAMGGAADVADAVAAAARAFAGPWSRVSNFDRARLLRALAIKIRDNARLLAELEVIDNGMPVAIAQLTVDNCATLFDYYAGWAERIEGTTTEPPPHVRAMGEALTYTVREAVGVVGQIVPWNVPLSMACMKIAPALAAGCTIVLKPAEDTPLTAIVLGRLIMEAGFPSGVVNIVNGLGAEAGAALVRHPDIAKIAFTGSTATGKMLVRECADGLKKISLELGGKSPVFVFGDADLERAVPGVAMATYFLQGQNCMAGARIFVHRSIYEPMLDGLAAFSNAMKIGHGLDPATQVGPLVSARQKERVLAFIDEARSGPARLIAGGGAPEGKGHFVQPTIFADVDPDMRIAREEIFGPVMAVQPFDNEDLDDLARLANDSVYGLSGSVWTRNLSAAHRMVSRIRSGHVSVNCHGAVAANIPFGGYRESGWGREFGREGMDLYLETKAVTVKL